MPGNAWFRAWISEVLFGCLGLGRARQGSRSGKVRLGVASLCVERFAVWMAWRSRAVRRKAARGMVRSKVSLCKARRSEER